MPKRFKTEVIDQGAGACLPRNLSDKWLQAVAQSAEDMMSGTEAGNGSVALAATLTILMAKQGADELTVSEEAMFARFQDYRIELGLEEVHRKTESSTSPPRWRRSSPTARSRRGARIAV